MKSYTLYLWLIVLLSVGLGFLLGSNQHMINSLDDESHSGQQKLRRFLEYLDHYYVDQIDTDSLATQVIQDLIGKLDPHSFYISPEELSEVTENMRGNFYGIGVSFFMVRDSVNIVRVLDGGPSKRVGLLAGDRILIANKDTLYGKKYHSQDIVRRLRGNNKTKIDLSIYRPSAGKVLTVELERGKVPLPSVAYYLKRKAIGYIKIRRFSETTNDEFQSAITDLIAQGMNQLILDLRDNPGGYLVAAEQIADTFLSKGKAIVLVQSNQGKKKVTYAKQGGAFEQGQVYVLINGQSASASEVVAGALQDNDRAWILGQRSFGKGLVQQQMPLGRQAAIRLTTARYYTPTGRSIQRPFKEGKDAYYAEIQERYRTGEMADKSKIDAIDSLAFQTPQGRTVYGGGGIVPDIYIPSQSSIEEERSAFFLSSNIVNHFVFTQLDPQRAEFESLERERFIVDSLENKQKWLAALKTYLSEQAVPIGRINEALAIRSIKSYLALQLFDEKAQIEVLHQQDPFVQKAIEKLTAEGKE